MQEDVKIKYPSPKGHVTVQLFEDGQLVNETENHNFISAGYLKGAVPYSAGYHIVYGKYVKSLDPTSRVLSPFHTALLTDASHPEDPENEWLPRGNVIGSCYANSSSQPADTIWGTINKLESVVRPDYVKVVMEFDTSRANGTFQSIYFVPQGTIFNSITTHDRPELATVRALRRHKGTLYGLLEVTSAVAFAEFDENLQVVQQVTIPSSSSFRDFIILDDDTIIYVKDATASTFNFATLADPGTVTKMVASNYNNAGSINLLSPTEVLVTELTNSGVGYKFVYYDLDAVAQTLTETRTEPFGYLSGINYASGLTRKIDDDTYVIGNYAYIAGEPIRQIFTQILAGYDEGLMYFKGFRFPKLFIGSRALLPEPITKTDKQSMKITYEFFLPAPY